MSPPAPRTQLGQLVPVHGREYICYSHSTYFTSFHGAVDLFFVNSRTYSRSQLQFCFFVVSVNVNRQFSTRFQYSCDFSSTAVSQRGFGGVLLFGFGAFLPNDRPFPFCAHHPSVVLWRPPFCFV
jgi:hypothetical protein